MRPRIGLDARFALGERRGIGNYSLELFRAMAAAHHEFDFIFYSDREDAAHELDNLPNSQVRVLRPSFYPLWEQVILPVALHQDGIDLFHSVGNTAPVILPRKTRLVITICDVMYMKPPSLLPMSTSWYQRLGRWYRRLVVPLAAKRADHLLTISEFSKSDICETLRGTRSERISVTLLGLPNAFSKLTQPALMCQPLGGAPYLLHLGGLDPRKNTKRVVQAFLSLRRAGRLESQLVILGLRSLESLDLTAEELAEAAHAIHLPGFVPESDLPGFYQHAKAFLFPSLYEGFGIPLLEAMACGVPIITSNTSSLPEVAGTAALLTDPLQVEKLKDAIQRLLESPTLQHHLHEEGRRQILKFDWTLTANATLTQYRKVLAAIPSLPCPPSSPRSGWQ